MSDRRLDESMRFDEGSHVVESGFVKRTILTSRCSQPPPPCQLRMSAVLLAPVTPVARAPGAPSLLSDSCRESFSVAVAELTLGSLHPMKTIVYLILFAACSSCLAQVDTNLIAAGDWSAIVRTDAHSPALRGRLLVYNDRGQSVANNHARVYLELQHVFTNAWFLPVEIYYNPDWATDLHLEMRDERNDPIPAQPTTATPSLTGPCWVTLPCDATVRLRGDSRAGHLTPSGLEVLVRDGCWNVPLNTINEFYLSGTFTASTNHPSPLKYPTRPSSSWRELMARPR